MRDSAGPGDRTARRNTPTLAFAWLVLCSVYSAFSLAAEYRTVSSACKGVGCPFPQLDADNISLLESAGIPIGMYSVAAIALAALRLASFLALSALLAARGRRPATALASAVFAALAVSSVGYGVLPMLDDVFWALSIAGTFWLLAAYPTLSLEPRWAAVPVLLAALWAVVLAFPPLAEARAGGEQPWATLEGLVFSVALAGVVVAQVLRYRRGGRALRRQLGMLLGVLALLILAGGAWSAALSAMPQWGNGSLAGSIAYEFSGFLLLVVGMTISWAIARESALGVAVNASLIGIALAVVFFSVYGLSIAVASRLLGGWMPDALAAFLASVVLAFLLRPLSRGIERMVYGDDDDPVSLVSALGAHLATASTSTVLAGLVEETAARLRLPELRVTFDGGPSAEARTVGTIGPTARVETLRSEENGSWRCDFTVRLPPGSPPPAPRWRRALHAAAVPLASAAAMDRLTENLRLSRLSLAATREGERRLLRQELHDEVVPTMASVRHRISAARAGQQPQTEVHLAAAEQALDVSIALVRGLAHSLRPPVLDDLGLREAINQFAGSLSTPTSVSERPLGKVPALVESTAYRIAVEALINAEQHARAQNVRVELSTDNRLLELIVADDGGGIPSGTPWGIGLVSMRERVDELGGLLTLGTTEPRGLTIRCELPLEIGELPARIGDFP